MQQVLVIGSPGAGNSTCRAQCLEPSKLEFLLYVLHFCSAWRGCNSAAPGQFAGTMLRFESSSHLARRLAAIPGADDAGR
ncbi:MAG: hypothetical protein NVSMB69_04750 [Novosphingobium sp.]